MGDIVWSDADLFSQAVWRGLSLTVAHAGGNSWVWAVRRDTEPRSDAIGYDFVDRREHGKVLAERVAVALATPVEVSSDE